MKELNEGAEWLNDSAAELPTQSRIGNSAIGKMLKAFYSDHSLLENI